MSAGGILFGVRKHEAMNRTATALDDSENVNYISNQLRWSLNTATAVPTPMVSDANEITPPS